LMGSAFKVKDGLTTAWRPSGGRFLPRKGFWLQKWSRVPDLVLVTSPCGSCGALCGFASEGLFFAKIEFHIYSYILENFIMIHKKQIISFGLLLILLLAETGCASGISSKKETSIPSTITEEPEIVSETVSMGNDVTHFSVDDTISDVIHHPLFTGFGKFILPLERGYDEDMPLSRVSTLLPYHSNIDPQSAVDTMNHMIDDVASGNTIFYPIYDDTKMQEHTGLFFFRGEPGAPFAIVSAGGGFSYVGSIRAGRSRF
jgi:hypothetical protein